MTYGEGNEDPTADALGGRIVKTSHCSERGGGRSYGDSPLHAPARRTTTLRLSLIGAAILGLLQPLWGGRAQPTYQLLHSFVGDDSSGFKEADGAVPFAALIQGPDGNFYGTTFNGSQTAAGAYGTVFKMDASGKVTTRREGGRFSITLSNGFSRGGEARGVSIHIGACDSARTNGRGRASPAEER